MSDQHRRILLENRCNRDHRDVLPYEIKRNEGVGREVEIEPPGGKQLRVIDLRPALPQRHLEPVLPVDPGGDRLIVAAVLGLGLPVRPEADCFCRRCITAQSQTGCGADQPSDQNALHWYPPGWPNPASVNRGRTRVERATLVKDRGTV